MYLRIYVCTCIFCWYILLGSWWTAELYLSNREFISIKVYI